MDLAAATYIPLGDIKRIISICIDHVQWEGRILYFDLYRKMLSDVMVDVFWWMSWSNNIET